MQIVEVEALKALNIDPMGNTIVSQIESQDGNVVNFKITTLPLDSEDKQEYNLEFELPEGYQITSLLGRIHFILPPNEINLFHIISEGFRTSMRASISAGFHMLNCIAYFAGTSIVGPNPTNEEIKQTMDGIACAIGTPYGAILGGSLTALNFFENVLVRDKLDALFQDVKLDDEEE